MESWTSILPTIIRMSGEDEDVIEQAVLVAWRKAAGEGVSKACVPFRLYRKQLVVAVLDQTWKKQMEQMSGEYLFKINSMLRGAYVTFIEFRVDRATVLGARGGDEREFEFHHTIEIEEQLRNAAESIPDEHLRETFLRAAARSLERKGE
ncbi:MAG: DciA family protein [Blastocatellales bacterium]